MERKQIEERVREIVEDTWYNMRSINPVEIQIKSFTDLILEIHDDVIEEQSEKVYNTLNEGNVILDASNHAKKEILKSKIKDNE